MKLVHDIFIFQKQLTTLQNVTIMEEKFHHKFVGHASADITTRISANRLCGLEGFWSLNQTKIK